MRSQPRQHKNIGWQFPGAASERKLPSLPVFLVDECKCLVTPVPDGCSTRRNVVAEEPSGKTLLQNKISQRHLNQIISSHSYPVKQKCSGDTAPGESFRLLGL